MAKVRTEVNSSFIESLSYDKDTKVLEIEFKNAKGLTLYTNTRMFLKRFTQ